jgi:plastocyanin
VARPEEPGGDAALGEHSGDCAAPGAEGNDREDHRMQLQARRTRLRAAFPVLFLGLLGGVALAAADAPAHHVSQKDQEFRPGQLDIKRGETVEIVNDDGDLLHHAYVESKSFNFDSGDQEPGAKVDIAFPVSGVFTVLCGIHPKMKLRVQVE